MEVWSEITDYDKSIDTLSPMENVICAVAKNENDYINDWCHYHFNLGYSDIFIYDNNLETSAFIGDFISSDIREKVHIIRIPNATEFQKKAYLHFYKSFNKIFKTVTYIDIDEFITLTKWNSINQLVDDDIFKNANVIRLGWIIYNDNGLIEKDLSKPVWERFTERTKSDWRVNQAKSIVRGNINGSVSFDSVHHPKINGRADKEYCVDGKINGNNLIRVNKEYSEAYIRHYMTKSLQEFIEYKINRGDAELEKSSNYYFFKENNLKKIFEEYYFKINDKTPEKIEYIKEKLNYSI